MAITADLNQDQKQKINQDGQESSSRDQSHRLKKYQRTNQNARTNWARDQEGSNKQKKMYCVFHGEDKGHTTKNCPETKKIRRE